MGQFCQPILTYEQPILHWRGLGNNSQYAAFPEKVIALFFKHDFLSEAHAAELTKVLNFKDLTPWLTRDQALTEILAGILDKHRGSSAGVAPTASVFTKVVLIFKYGLLSF